jgi:hypothetical protein
MVHEREIYSSINKDRFLLVYAMKAQGGNRSSASLTPKLGTKLIRMVSITSRSIPPPRNEPAVPTEEEFSWLTEPVCVF